MSNPPLPLPLPDLTGLSDQHPWLFLDATGGTLGLHGFLVVGAKRTLNIPSADPDAYRQIAAFVGAASGRCFGWIGYDQTRAHPLLDLPDQGNVAVALPAVHWTEPEGVLAFERTAEETHLEWLVRPGSTLSNRMEAAFHSTAPEEDDAPQQQPMVSGSSSLARTAYGEAFSKVHAHILRGDIYELNLCREIRGVLSEGWCPNAAFQRMTRQTSAPFSALLQWNGVDILCASPERFLRREGDRLISQPIKGTAPRHPDSERDAAIAKALQSDQKERAENIMIADLVRNDLSQVARPSTVEVEELCGIHSFKNVHQMVSTVTCSVREDKGFADIMQAAFPMGSMTGAPKIRAMEIAAEVEPVRRGLYSGAIGWAEPDGSGGAGDFDFNVVIRTALADRHSKRWSVHVGGAITALAREQAEWDETRLKAKAVLDALGALESATLP